MSFIFPILTALLAPHLIMVATVMHQNTSITDKIGMTILDLKVKDLNRLVEFDKVDTLDSYSVPILSVNSIAGIQISSIYPALAFYLEGVSFGTLDNLTVNIKLDKSINFVYRGRDNLLFCSFAGNVVMTSPT